MPKTKPPTEPWFLAIAKNDLVAAAPLAAQMKDSKNINGTTALMLASSKGYVEIIDLCLRHGADLQAVDIHGDTALHYALSTQQNLAAEKLLQAGIRTDSQRKDQITPLMLSIQLQNLEIAKKLVPKSNLAAQNEDGWTALHYAVNLGLKDFTQHLIENKSPLELADLEGSTPLFFAVEDQNLEITRMLLKAGANAKTIRNDLLNPESLARFYKNDALIKLLQLYTQKP